jgi:hypothetical protein
MSNKKTKKGVHAGDVQHFLKQVNETVPEGYKNQKNLSKPDHDWVIEHVYGFSGDRNKSCLFFGANNNEIIFPAAALGVSMNLTTREQRFFGGLPYQKGQEKYTANWPCHQDDISDLQVMFSEGKGIAISGEVGAKSTIHIWDT